MITSRARGRAGYSLVEILVSIGIIATLLGLLLPAVQKSRGGAARLQCLNNLHQLGLAAEHAHSTYQQYPPIFHVWPGGTGGRLGGVFWHLLPFVEQQALYQGPIAGDEAAPAMRLYQCPSDPTSSSGTPTTSYLVNEFVFHGRKSPLFVDGASQTVLFTETYANCDGANPVYWSNTSSVTLFAYGPAATATFRAAPSTSAATAGNPRGCSVELGDNAQAAHAGVIHVALADGSVRPVSKAGADQPAAVPGGRTSTNWAAAFTPGGGETFGSEW
ncbi:DUF1559 domain-containing protein [Fimbriiglobus ruber]|uniref:DUF1559 domain-containing protein n=1 Tax=Fimbriiglobus ruber TaxID=1908690 RepID=A0A225E031_9BACT|nr:DUF1559 domain-containing protein [Fimbriiglobus ruber]OWK45164.1 hypothetical protein FRUB_01495 [Fimbriiglobus ruber]